MQQNHEAEKNGNASNGSSFAKPVTSQRLRAHSERQARVTEP
jgi:hypothetical protein